MLWGFLLRARDHGVRPRVAFLEDGPVLREVAAIGLDSDLIPFTRLRSPVGIARGSATLSRLVSRHRPDVVLAWMSKAQILTGTAAACSRRWPPLVWWQHGVADGPIDRVATFFPADAVGCSSRIGQQTQARLRPRRQTFVVHPGVRDAEPVNAARRAEARTALGLPVKAVVLGLVGRLDRHKGQDRLIRIVGLLLERGHAVHGIVVGGDTFRTDPSYADGLPLLVDELGLGAAITFTGQVVDPSLHYAAMDLLVSPGRREGFGMVLAEAMMHGVPPVAFAEAGPKEILRDPRCGRLTMSPEPSAMVDAVEELLRDPEALRAMSLAAHAEAKARFSLATMTERICAELTGITRRSG